MKHGTGLAESNIGTSGVGELYLAGDFEKVYNQTFDSVEPEFHALHLLAGFELGFQSEGEATGSYAPLVEGMRAFYHKNYRLASTSIASWLIKSDTVSSMILRRFIHSAEHSANFGLLYSVGKRFISNKEYRTILAEPLLKSAYQLQKHQEVVELFEKYREFYTDQDVIFQVAFCLMQLERFDEAERFLLFLYKKVNGTDYELNYDEVKARYSGVIKDIPRLEKIKEQLSDEEKMELGMAYIFSSRYGDALEIFTALSR